MEASATPKRLTIRYFLEQADAPLRAQTFHSAYVAYPCTASRACIPIVSYTIASRNRSLLGKSNNLVTFRSFVFPPMSARETKTQKHILRP